MSMQNVPPGRVPVGGLLYSTRRSPDGAVLPILPPELIDGLLAPALLQNAAAVKAGAPDNTDTAPFVWNSSTSRLYVRLADGSYALVPASGGGGNQRAFGVGSGQIHPFAEGDSTGRWPFTRLPVPVFRTVNSVAGILTLISDLRIVEHTDWANVADITEGAFRLLSFNSPASISTSAFAVSHLADQLSGSSPFYNMRMRIPIAGGYGPEDFRFRVGDVDVPTQWSEDTPDATYRYFDELGGVELANGSRIRIQRATRTHQTEFSGDVPETPTRDEQPASKKYVDGNSAGLTLQQQVGLLKYYVDPPFIEYTDRTSLIAALTRTFRIGLLNANLVTSDCWYTVEMPGGITERAKLDTTSEQRFLSVTLDSTAADLVASARNTVLALQAKFYNAESGGNQIGEIRDAIRLVDTSVNKVQRLVAGAAIAWDVDNGNVAQLLLGQNGAVTIAGGNDGDYAILTVTQDSTGGNSLAFRGVNQGAFGITQPAQAGGAITHYVFFRFGATWTMFYNSNAIGSVVQPLPSGSTIGWNLSGSSSDIASVTLAENTMFSISGGRDGQSALLRVTQDGTGGRTLGFSTGAGFVGTAPTLSTGAGDIDVLAFHKIGTVWHFMGIKKDV